MNKQLIVVVGPTAVGKTALAIELAKHFQTEIISCDSRQFFKELTIGTAKPNEQELTEVKHHFINNKSINEDYNAGNFETDAIQLLNKLFETKNIVIMVGGSGLYVDAVCRGFDQLPNKNDSLRKELNNLDIEQLQQQLKKLDAAYFQRVDINNKQRIIRALEVCLATNMPYSTFLKTQKKIRTFNCIKIGLHLDREPLYNRINKRVEQMMKDGLLDEAKKTISFREKNALQTVGYKELFDYFDGKTTLEEAVALIQQNSRRYAKRQMTWFRKDQNIHWFKPNEKEAIILKINDLILTSNL
jgi:tRNA dimethylallyltransferase